MPPPWTKRLSVASGVVAVVSSLILIIALVRYGRISDLWFVQVSIFAFVTFAPQFLVDVVAQAAEATATGQLGGNTIKRGFNNLGAWVGIIERPLLLSSLVGGFPQFLAGWYVLKGIAGYRLGLDNEQLAERRGFQLFLINNGTSFAGVAIAWLVWTLLRLPVR